MDCRNRQTMTASPAKPGGLPISLAGRAYAELKDVSVNVFKSACVTASPKSNPLLFCGAQRERKTALLTATPDAAEKAKIILILRESHPAMITR